MHSSSQILSKQTQLVSKAKAKAYMSLIFIALNELNGNRGNLRKKIWEYLITDNADNEQQITNET